MIVSSRTTLHAPENHIHTHTNVQCR